MHLYKTILVDMGYMFLFTLFLKKAINCHSLFGSFGFRHESYFISLFLFFKVWSVSGDYILRKGINWNTRRLEKEADFGAKKVGMER